MKRIDMWAIDMVFVVGGNGGNAGAAAIQAQCEQAGVTCSVIGIPKSIDNDILLVCCLSYMAILLLFLFVDPQKLEGSLSFSRLMCTCGCADRQVLWL